MACSAVGSSTAANPLSSGSKPISALAAWRLAHSLPLMHSLALYGKYEQNFRKNGPKSASRQAPVGRRRGVWRSRSFSGALRPEPDVRVSPHHGSPVIYSVDVVVGCLAWMMSWQGGQDNGGVWRRFSLR